MVFPMSCQVFKLQTKKQGKKLLTSHCFNQSQSLESVHALWDISYGAIMSFTIYIMHYISDIKAAYLVEITNHSQRISPRVRPGKPPRVAE